MRRFRYRLGLGFLPALAGAMLLGACSWGGGIAPAGVDRSATSDGLRRATSSGPAIYVADLAGDKITVYGTTGKLVRTITVGIDGPFGVTVDKAGKIFVANTLPHTGGNVTTYTADGKQTTPTITDGIEFPLDVLVDKQGKIYVSNLTNYSSNGYVTTYKPDGTRTTPTITAGIAGPVGLATDAGGKIYVANVFNNTVTTYNADGTQTTPTISTGLDSPRGIAVDANGKIYVANCCGARHNTGYVATFMPDGTQTIPTISGFQFAQGVTVDTSGKIYVTSFQGPGNKGGFGSVTAYTADGKHTTPTIKKGIAEPALLTFH
ncbi:MAG TPA: NHL repeat-containing protein [Candidatus Cybelea sp.]